MGLTRSSEASLCSPVAVGSIVKEREKKEKGRNREGEKGEEEIERVGKC